MKLGIKLDRRRFVQMVGGVSLLGAASRKLAWAGAPGMAMRAARFAYVGGENAIHVYAIADKRFIKKQTVVSALPVAMTINAGNLYVGNGVSEYGGLPCGSVEAYAIDEITGRLEFRNRAPLSLSGIEPRDLAVAPDRRSIVVAVHGGGAYNLLSLDEDGGLGKVTAILKETGSGPHALQSCAHPSAVMFDREGRLLTADQGSDLLSVLSLSNSSLKATGRCEVAAGSGPSSMVLEPEGERLYIAHALNGSLSGFVYDATSGRIMDCVQTVSAPAAGEMATLVMHPSGTMLFSSHGTGIQCWKISRSRSLQSAPGIEGMRVKVLHLTPDGEILLALSSDGVMGMKIDAASCTLNAPVELVSLAAPACVATL
jgi:6-phosphogluconolactonase